MLAGLFGARPHNGFPVAPDAPARTWTEWRPPDAPALSASREPVPSEAVRAAPSAAGFADRVARPDRAQAELLRAMSRAAPVVGAMPPASAGPPSATAPAATPKAGAASGATAPADGLSAEGRAILHAQACQRLDPEDRPADCPVLSDLRRDGEAAAAPRYRPERAEGFSANEQRWRDIPPPCLKSGENAALRGSRMCVRFGTVPSRVRSPKEICEARGLGGCADPPPQAAVDAAARLSRAQADAPASAAPAAAPQD